MRIVIATIMRREGETGVQAHFNHLAHGLAAQGDDVSIVNCFDVGKLLYIPIYAVRPLLLARYLPAMGVAWYRLWHYWFLWLSLYRTLRKADVDVVNAQCPLSAKAAFSVRHFLGQHFRILLTCHFNVSQAEEFAGKGQIARQGFLYRRILHLEEKVLGQVDGVVFVSQYSAQRILDFHRSTPCWSSVIWNGIGHIVAKPREEVREKLGIDEDRPVIAMVGTLEPRKNQRFLLAVLSEMHRAGVYAALVLIGNGPDRALLESASEALGLRKDVYFLGHQPDAAQMLMVADVYCHPALEESFGIAVLEAMSVGIPVVAAPVGGIPEFLIDGVNGYLAAAGEGDVSAFSATVMEVLAQCDQTEVVVKNARKFVATQCSDEQMSKHYKTAYDFLLGDGV